MPRDDGLASDVRELLTVRSGCLSVLETLPLVLVGCFVEILLDLISVDEFLVKEDTDCRFPNLGLVDVVFEGSMDALCLGTGS